EKSEVLGLRPATLHLVGGIQDRHGRQRSAAGQRRFQCAAWTVQGGLQRRLVAILGATRRYSQESVREDRRGASHRTVDRKKIRVGGGSNRLAVRLRDTVLVGRHGVPRAQPRVAGV